MTQIVTSRPESKTINHSIMVKDRLRNLPPVFVALDMARAEVASTLDQLDGLNIGLKVGMELFYQTGPDFVRELAAKAPVFLDLKLHDIPNTVASAAAQIADLGVRLTTVHASGGRAMLDGLAALERPDFRLLAVTVLTSADRTELEAVGVANPDPGAQARRLFTLADECGLGGFVCSPQEVASLRALAPGALFVTPGVRPAGTAHNDQTRIATPAQAMANGATSLVIGRPITRAENPRAATEAILAEVALG